MKFSYPPYSSFSYVQQHFIFKTSFKHTKENFTRHVLFFLFPYFHEHNEKSKCFLENLTFKIWISRQQGSSKCNFCSFSRYFIHKRRIKQCNPENVLHNCRRFRLMLWKVLTEVLSQALTISFSWENTRKSASLLCKYCVINFH